MTTITTAAELDALPHLSVVLADLEGRAAQKDTSYDPPRWWVTGQPTALDNEDMRAVLPLTVLYRPDQPPATVETATVKPIEEAVAEVLYGQFTRNRIAEWDDITDDSDQPRYAWLHAARAVIGLLDSQRPEAEVKAEALREAAAHLRRQMAYFPQGGRNTRAGWAVEMLDTLADRIEREG